MAAKRKTRRIVLHADMCTKMKTNITLNLDANLLREARILAAEEGSSISGLVAAKLEEIVRSRKRYDRSKHFAP